MKSHVHTSQIAWERQDLPCMYLAHHELESVAKTNNCYYCIDRCYLFAYSLNYLLTYLLTYFIYLFVYLCIIIVIVICHYHV